jgi:hypothetical protein
MTTVEKIGIVEINGEWHLMVKHRDGPCWCGCDMELRSDPVYYKMPSKGEAERIYAEMITDRNSNKESFMRANWSRVP